MITKCLRCKLVNEIPQPEDPHAQEILKPTAGFCANCTITWFLLSVAAVQGIINGTKNGVRVDPGTGPEILLGRCIYMESLTRVIDGILEITHISKRSINWVEVVSNWGEPWPAGRDPKVGANF